MATKYVMRETPDLHGDGKKVLYPKMVIVDRVDSRRLAENVSHGSTFSVGEVEGLIADIASHLATLLARGCSVKIDGIGLFTPSLALRKCVERETAGEDGKRVNAASIEVGNVNFRPEKELLNAINAQCDLERSPLEQRRKPSPYTKEERLAKALAHLGSHAVMTVREYAEMTGLARTTAAMELRAFASTPGSGLAASGSGPKKVYVKE